MKRALVVIVVTVGSANAQPSTVAPTTPAPTTTEPAPYVYPRRLVDRPVVLPEGAFDGLLGISAFNNQSAYLVPSVRYATPAFELSFGLTEQIGDRPDDAHLRAIYIGGLREIVPCRVPGLAVGGQLVAFTPASDQPGFSPNVLAYYKRKLASWVAINPSASFGYDYGQALDENDMEGSIHQLDGSLTMRFQLQAGEIFAFELMGRASYVHDLGEYARFALSSHGEQAWALSVLLSATENTDLLVMYQRQLRELEFASDGIFLALGIRRI